ATHRLLGAVDIYHKRAGVARSIVFQVNPNPQLEAGAKAVLITGNPHRLNDQIRRLTSGRRGRSRWRAIRRGCWSRGSGAGEGWGRGFSRRLNGLHPRDREREEV